MGGWRKRKRGWINCITLLFSFPFFSCSLSHLFRSSLPLSPSFLLFTHNFSHFFLFCYFWPLLALSTSLTPLPFHFFTLYTLLILYFLFPLADCTLGGLNSNLTGNSDSVRKCESITMSSFSVKNCPLDPPTQGVGGGPNVDESLGGDLNVDCYPINYTSCQLNAASTNTSRPSIDRFIHGTSSNLDEEISDSKNQHSPTHVTSVPSSNRTPGSRSEGKKQQQPQQQQQQQATALLHLYSSSHQNANSQSVTSSMPGDSSDRHHQLLRTSLQLASSDHIYDMPHRMNQLAIGTAGTGGNGSSALAIGEGSIILLNNPPPHGHPHSESSLHLHTANLHESQSEFDFQLASSAFGQQQQFIQPQSSQGSGFKQVPGDLKNRLDFVHIFDCASWFHGSCRGLQGDHHPWPS